MDSGRSRQDDAGVFSGTAQLRPASLKTGTDGGAVVRGKASIQDESAPGNPVVDLRSDGQ